MERFGVQGIQFVLQIILARILDPDHYGELSMMIIFTALANVFIQTGFNMALIQNKDVTEEDYSSVFWVSLAIAVVLYGVIFFAAPFIAAFYKMENIVNPLRVLALTLFPGVLNSIQLAKVSREMDFKKIFLGNVLGILIAGATGIVVAKMGGGLWALVVQNIMNISTASIVMLFTVRWYPKWICNLNRVASLFRFGWKLLVANVMGVFYSSIYSLVIGKKYSPETLGFYNRGIQFPSFIIDGLDSSVQSVMLPALSELQDDKNSVRTMMRESMMMSAYVVLPMMVGLSVVAEPLVLLLLTEKWLPCVPYMQLYCLACGIDPVHSCNLQAINAMGRSDIFLRLEIVKKIYFTIILLVIIFCFDSPIAIAATAILDAIICWVINAFPNKKLLDYSVRDQVRDLFPSILVALFMGIVVLLVGRLELAPLGKLLVQVPTGVAVYFLMSWWIKPKPFVMMLKKFQPIVNKFLKR